MTTPEAEARIRIDQQLDESGWIVQDRDAVNLAAGVGVAVREFKLAKDHGYADYLLFVDRQAVGVVEAKKAGFTLSGVEVQSAKYSTGLPDHLDAPHRPLPFCYESTGAETKFTNCFDPKPRSRRVCQFHRPETLAAWLQEETLDEWVKGLLPEGGFYTAADASKPSTLRSRLQVLPPLDQAFLYRNQIRAVTNLEESLKEDKPRALIQMATGSGKTIMAVTAMYRLIKYGGARRVLFLVDRGNLGEQAEKELQGYRTPDDNRKFTELYNVQRLAGNTIGESSKVVISTIQRLYSMLKGEPDFDPEGEEVSLFEAEEALPKEPLPVVYNAMIPPEYFDVIVVDECHRSIYTLWRQVLEYFDAYLVGLTATPAKHTYGFFNQNLVMEYTHEEAVADNVNVDYEIYRIRTRITAEGSTIEAGAGLQVGYRDRATRQTRWELPDEDVTYTGKELDRNVVAKDQIRLIARTLKEKLPTEIFPGRSEVPKTLIFAKNDSHAEDIVGIFREEFGEGNDFCQKITYKTTGRKPADLIQDFRNSYFPRVAVTVDMIATGTDIKPIECVVFMRTVKSRVLFEQMKGRGVRTIGEDDLRAVSQEARVKTHFVVVDCVGITESKLADSGPLEKKRSTSFKALLEHVAHGGTHPDYLSSLASRLARLDKQCGKQERERLEKESGGATLSDISAAIVKALDPDVQIEHARKDYGLAPGDEPTDEQIQSAANTLRQTAVEPLATQPKYRKILVEVKKSFEQVIDEVTQDELLESGFSAEDTAKAKEMTAAFRKYLDENPDEIEALQFFYSQPYKARLRFEDIKAIHEAIQSPPRSWTPERLWEAYRAIETNKVRGASSSRRLTDIISLIRYALEQEGQLVPYSEQVDERFSTWVAQQENRGRAFDEEQIRWLVMIRDHVAGSLGVELEDFELEPFAQQGGLGKAAQVFRGELRELIDELNGVLVA